jgi:hypothetical protein
VRAGRRPRPATPQLRAQRRGPLRAGVRRGVRRAVRVHPDRPRPPRWRPAARPSRCGPARAEPPADQFPEARRLPRRAVTRAAIEADFTDESLLHVDKTTIATLTDVAGVVGEPTSTASSTERRTAGTAQRVAYELARHVVRYLDTATTTCRAHPLFPQIVQIAKRWLAECVTYEPGLRRVDAATFAELRTAPPSGSTPRSCAARTTAARLRPILRPTTRRLHRRRLVLHPQGGDRRPKSTSTTSRSTARQGQHVGGGDRRDLLERHDRRRGVREERPPRIPHPVRARRDRPRLPPRLPRSPNSPPPTTTSRAR